MSYTRYLTAELLIRKHILMDLFVEMASEEDDDMDSLVNEPRIAAFLNLTQRSGVHAKVIMDAWDLARERFGDTLQDCQEEMRVSGIPTNIPARDFSRHFECEERGAELSGVWVGWTYWRGGGKHGNPEAIPWIEQAYLLDVTEEERVVTVRTFRIKE